MLHELQRDFRAGVLDGRRDAVVASILDDGVAPAERFDIYRSNTFASLIAVLGEAFPVVRRLVGDAFFDAMAAVFVRRAPPDRPQLLDYGSAFADFIDGFAPAADVPYLADVARLEWLRDDAYNAADATPLDPAALQAMPPARIPELRLALHPSATPFASPFPVFSIWDANRAEHEVVAPLDLAALGGECVLVARPAMHVQTTRISVGDCRLLKLLDAGRTLGQAAEAALAVEPDLDLMRALAAHLAGGHFAAIR